LLILFIAFIGKFVFAVIWKNCLEKLKINVEEYQIRLNDLFFVFAVFNGAIYYVTIILRPKFPVYLFTIINMLYFD
jgi:hypothetical protein